jgi:hypothetical protein
VRVLIDDTQVFSVTDATTAYDAGYTKITVDLTAFGGGARTLRFEERNVAAPTRFRVHVDDVSVMTTPNACSNPKIYLPIVVK